MTSRLTSPWFFTTAGILVLFAPITAHATLVPFTEDFASNSANWRNSTGTLNLGWVSSGGPDSSSYAAGDFNFLNSASGNTPALLRAQDEFNSSGNAFVGNWINDGVNQFSVYVRHDAPQALTFFTRFAGPSNFPGVAAVNFAPVQPNAWTQLVFPIVSGNPQFVFEGPGSTFSTVFSNLGHIQIGVQVPTGLAGVDQLYHFDVDQAQIVPEPAGLLLLVGGAGLFCTWLRGRRADRGGAR